MSFDLLSAFLNNKSNKTSFFKLFQALNIPSRQIWSAFQPIWRPKISQRASLDSKLSPTTLKVAPSALKNTHLFMFAGVHRMNFFDTFSCKKTLFKRDIWKISEKSSKQQNKQNKADCLFVIALVLFFF